MSRRHLTLAPAMLLRAYRAGLFPMAETRDSARIYWLDPEQRGILPLAGFHCPRRLWRTVRAGRFQVTGDQAFGEILALCAQSAPGREESWISGPIADAYLALAASGHAHSIEVWEDGRLAGGLYGVALGGAFFGESMVSRARDASKVALVHLVARLRLGGFALLDTQFITTHLAQFGAHEVPRAAYRDLLDAALARDAQFLPAPPPAALAAEFAAMRKRADNAADETADDDPDAQPARG